jgi:hypothetical protein
MLKKRSFAKSSAAGLAGALLLTGLCAANAQAEEKIKYTFIDSTAKQLHDLTVSVGLPDGTELDPVPCLVIGQNKKPTLEIPAHSTIWLREYRGSTGSCNLNKSGGELKIASQAQYNAKDGVIDLATI